jgi:hypothetical protein
MKSRSSGKRLTQASTLALAVGAAIGPAAAGGRELAVTVYNENLALVKDARTLDLGSGRQTYRLTDVSAQIDPTSVHLVGRGGGGLEVLEQNYQYDLVSADRILDRYLDQEITVLGKDGLTTTGALLSYDSGNLVIDRKPGLAIVSRGEVKEIQCSELPGGLITRPTLVWLLDNGGAARRDVELSYLSGGLSWHAEYVAVLAPDDRALSWSGWVSLENKSGTTFPAARLKLVAGDVNRVRDEMVKFQNVMRSAAMEAQPQFAEEQFFEYHLYALARPTTLADRETKQLSLFPTADVKATKVFTYEWTRDPTRVRVTMEFRNAAAAGLGMALPKGKVRVYKEDKGGAQEFVGEDRIDHTAKDEEVRILVGNAFDVVGEHKQTDTRRISQREVETSHSVTLRNHKAEAVTVKVIEHAAGDWQVTDSSQKYDKKDATTFEFTVDLPADGERTVTYTLRQR